MLFAPASGTSHYGGLAVCGSVWHCPCCAAKISSRRRDELTQALAAAAERGWFVVLVTLTLRHKRSDPLRRSLEWLKNARSNMMAGKAAQSFGRRYEQTGMIRAMEITHGTNGWHPHLHVLYFFAKRPPLLRLERDIKQRWTAAVARAGGSATLRHGADVRCAEPDIAAYVAKFGREPTWTAADELARAASKRGRTAAGRTPAQLLADAAGGDELARKLWLVYAVEIAGTHQLQYSRGLRAALGLAIEKSDQELATEQSEIAIVLASLSHRQWQHVLGNDARGELLAAAATGDAGRVRSFLVAIGVYQS